MLFVYIAWEIFCNLLRWFFFFHSAAKCVLSVEQLTDNIYNTDDHQHHSSLAKQIVTISKYVTWGITQDLVFWLRLVLLFLCLCQSCSWLVQVYYKAWTASLILYSFSTLFPTYCCIGFVPRSSQSGVLGSRWSPTQRSRWAQMESVGGDRSCQEPQLCLRWFIWAQYGWKLIKEVCDKEGENFFLICKCF